MQAGVPKEERVTIKFEGILAELLERIDPKLYSKFIRTERGKKVLYAEMTANLYGTLKAAVRWYILVCGDLDDWGFTINPYDPCVEQSDDEDNAPTAGVHDADTAGVVDDSSDDEQEEQADIEADMNTRYGEHSGAYNLRPRSRPNYSREALFAATGTIAPGADPTGSPDGILDQLAHVVMAQYNLRKGLQKFGEPGKEAVLKEVQQLHDRKAITPINPDKLRSGSRSEALRLLMFLKQKRDGTIKGRGCADGRNQRAYIPKDEASAPTVSTEALFLTAAVAANEGRYVATLDVPGAFLQAGVPKEERVTIKFEGILAELLERIDPKLYSKFIRTERGKKVLYAEMTANLYGTLKAAVRWYILVCGDLDDWGFTISPYDPCTADTVIC